MRSFPRLLALLIAFGVLAGCATRDRDDRHLQPIPAALVAEMREKGMSERDPILIRIFKQESELEIWKQDRTGRYALLKTYPMCRWSGRLGPKTRSGDRQAPEGFYHVTPDLMNPRSSFYLSFNLGYPNALESALGYTGQHLMVHGACSSAGCYAMTDQAMAEIYAVAREAFKGGQAAFQVQALPFRMNARNLAKHRDDPNMPFWLNLKEGADAFAMTRREPVVAACGGRYVFNARPSDPASRFDPAAPCPDYVTDPAIAGPVAAKHERDMADKAAILANGGAPAAMTYLDGGMHASFRRMLRDVGPQRMARMTSGAVEISRPDAALADPYGASMATGR